MSEDPFATFDAAYVLGALSPEDRQRFETHLRTCDHCAASVRELAGLPGLLARVDPAPVALETGPPPPDLLPGMLRRVRRGRRIRGAVTSASAALAVSACVALAVVASTPPPSPAVPPGLAMTALGEFPLRADASLAAFDWGTQVDMSCSYTGERSSGEYVLVAISRAGVETQLATWKAVPDNTARIVIGTALKRTDLAALEVRGGTSGRPLLRLTL
ncbi:zf-HC2 domain-containing protein [Amycolatopsis sp. OK19-0408]|uniref:Zf-HC2 domain-containing protein n=1 Tax=Amycolatopsis iheyensis TaxID=2945988 RepID=A0A9X2N8P5_9PSEU|nr:zf-HC2 domain-containing protein [Amycolatopsis iheyensis]MCR6482616.1 zf-HC2 domain-containing protein [Amycolatopsis iheyensis]